MSGTIVVTSRSFGSGSVDFVSTLETAGYEVVFGDPHHDPQSLTPLLARADAWIAGTSPVTADLLARAPQLAIVARYGVGFDAVDLAAAEERGIVVTNTPGANSASVADLALTLLLGGLRTVAVGDRAVRAGDWSAVRGREIDGLEVGVAGFGRIGRLFADRARALGARVLAYDPFLTADEPLPDGYRRADAVAELAACGAVSLHAPGGATIVDAAWLARADGLALVNTARADLVDEDAVAAALRDGRLSSYSADTLASEAVGDSRGPLLAEDLAGRIVVTPHLGAQTVQAIDRMGSGAVANVLAVLGGDVPPNPVTPIPARKVPS
ncbi:NAD(P)-dependent oxidoreductase [Leifsonia sp. AG29]|uniref:NAD(P)-dependent oxidoreductase n=1 Tax=Leifsonia sp. AG29 TaxID=2598860 RepID=UPI00131CD1B7|nr:NAD(P)-dependent oxidoreductase [Leifsonia sp. AG29]